MKKKTIRDAQRMAWEIAEEKGFHKDRSSTGRDDTLVRLCLIHTEISEAAQEVKRGWKGEPDARQREVFAEELADAMIRILELAECIGVDMGEAVFFKMEQNRKRPYRYGTPDSGEVKT